jgi:coniferyl-aldehyde dehydrogenase
MNIDQVQQRELAQTEALNQLLHQQRAANLQRGFPSADVRIERLKRLAKMMEDHREEWIHAVNQDFGQRSDFETQVADILPVLNAIHHAIKKLHSWMRPELKSVAIHFLPGRAQVHFQPLGVIGVIAPWNFPVSLALSPTVSALAAGNSVMIKPSEHTPATSALMEKLVSQYFDASELCVVTGGEDIGRSFCNLAFDHLLFTGSTQVGKSVMRAASANLVPVTLELGGKSPVIIDNNYPIEKAAGSIAFGKFVNAGQICISPDYVLIPEDLQEELIWSLQTQIRTMYPSVIENKDYTAIINPKNVARLNDMIEDARSKGARVIQINPSGENLSTEHQNKIAPTLVLGVNESMRIADEEIFGPLLPIFTYKSLDEAIHFVNSRPRPLSLYVFSHSRENQKKILANTCSGGVTINDTLQHYLQDDLPFGGVGPSGMGSYHGKDGFLTFSHKRSVFLQSRLNGAGMLRAPYGHIARFILKVMTP